MHAHNLYKYISLFFWFSSIVHFSSALSSASLSSSLFLSSPFWHCVFLSHPHPLACAFVSPPPPHHGDLFPLVFLIPTFIVRVVLPQSHFTFAMCAAPSPALRHLFLPFFLSFPPPFWPVPFFVAIPWPTVGAALSRARPCESDVAHRVASGHADGVL